MSREEAAFIYIDGLLGFRSGYETFLQAGETLTDQEKSLLVDATMDTVKASSHEAGIDGDFFDPTK